jgi:preflagellin peptidase FlaK
MNEILDGARVLLSLSFLFYASWSDWKSREVSNKVWIVMAPLALALTLFQLVVFSPQSLLFYALSFAITATLSVALFYVGAFGGADAKALMCLALALPTYPNNLFQFDAPHLSPILPIIVFSNAVVLAALSVAYAVVRNSFWKFKKGTKLFEGFENESIWRKLLAFLSGYKVKTAELEKGHMFPLEDITVNEAGEEKRRLLVFPKDEKTEKIVERILSAIKKGKLQNEVWATPGLPLLVFITIGLIVALIFGDLIWIFLRFILP